MMSQEEADAEYEQVTERMRTGRHLRSVNMMTGWPGLLDRAAPTAFIEEVIV